MKSLSFREMSALGSAVAVVLIAYLYFPSALMVASSSLHEVLPDGSTHTVEKTATLITFAVGSVIALAVLQIIYHIIIAIVWRSEAGERADERDRMVSLKAGRIAYVVLIAGLCALTWYLLVHGVSNLLAAQYAFLIVFAGEFIRYCATFVYYRLSV